MRNVHTGLVAMAMLCASAVGCYRNHTNEAPRAIPAGDEVVRVIVDNNSLTDVNVVAEADGGAQTRLGTVPAGTESVYKLGANLPPNGKVQLVALGIGGQPLAHTGPLPVFTGNEVNFTIQPNPKQSFATVRFGGIR